MWPNDLVGQMSCCGWCVSQTEKLPRLHWSHSPQMIVNGTTMRSPFFKLAVHAGADLDHLAHHLVAHDVAGQHRRDEIVKEMKVRAADGAARHLDDGIARILDLRIRDGVAADVFLAVPNQRFHLMAPDRIRAPSVRSPQTCTAAVRETAGTRVGSGASAAVRGLTLMQLRRWHAAASHLICPRESHRITRGELIMAYVD